MPASPAATAPDGAMVVSVSTAALARQQSLQIYDLFNEGKLAWVQIGRRRVVEVSELKRFLAAHRVRRDRARRHDGRPGRRTSPPTADADRAEERAPGDTPIGKVPSKARSRDVPARPLNASALRLAPQGCLRIYAALTRQECEHMNVYLAPTCLLRQRWRAKRATGHGNIRKRKFRDGTTHLTRQCARCGAQIGAWLKQDAYVLANIPPVRRDPAAGMARRDESSLL